MNTRRLARLVVVIVPLVVILVILLRQGVEVIQTTTEEGEPVCATASAADSERETSSGAAEGGSIYVSTGGKDETGDGSITNPFRTIGCALIAAQPGDEIVLRGAPALDRNRYQEEIRIQEPDITIRSETGEWAIVECPINDQDEDSCVHFDVGSDGGSLQRVEVIGGYYYGIKFETTWDWDEVPGGEGASNILIKDVKVHDTGNAAVKITPGCDGITLRRVELYNSGRRDPDSAEGIDNVNGDQMTVQDSYIHDTGGTGLYFKGGATDCVVERSRIERTGGAGVLLGFDTSPEYFDLAVNPKYYESIRGVVRNNIISTVPWAGIGLYGAKDAQVLNNTIVDAAREEHSPIYFGLTYQDWEPGAGRPASVNPTILNNLVYQSAGLPAECVFIRYDEEDELGKMSALEGMPAMDYNLYYAAAGSCVFTDMRPGSELSQGTFAQWQAHIDGDAHSLPSDPQLTADGHLPSGSPAVDAGTCAAAPADDIDTDRRPGGATCDIGADEFTFGQSPSPF